MLLAFAVGAGARAVAGEHEEGRLDLVISYPLHRQTYLLGRAAVVVLLVAGYVGLAMTTIWLSGLAVDLGLGPAELCPAALMLMAFAGFFGGLALLVGSWRLDRRIAIAVPSGLALAGWVVNSLAAIATWLEPVRSLSPLWWYSRQNALRDGLDAGGFCLLLGGAMLFLALALRVFDRRDLA
jgi:ABC-2 type transport system permease protein